MRVPWTARRSNQSKEINPEHLLKGLMLKLKLQYFGHLMERGDSLEKTLMLGKKKAKGHGHSKGGDDYSFIDSMDMSYSKLWDILKPGMLQSVWLQKNGHDLATEQEP